MRKGEGEVGRIKVWKGTEMVDRSGVRIMLRLPRKARFRIIMVAHGGDCEVFAASHVAHSKVRAGIASILPTIIHYTPQYMRTNAAAAACADACV